LLNFVQNGAEAISGEGLVTLRSRFDQRKLHGELRRVVIIDIIDTGSGMPPEIQKRLFDPFFTTKEEGTGLGLPIAARIVEKHHGAIEYQTAPGQGTTFSIILPRISEHERET
jgi:two-component system sensor histidine kinase AtoS